MKVVDAIRKESDEGIATIIGAIVLQRVEGIPIVEAIKFDYPNTLKALQQEIEIDYKQTNADRIRSMSYAELATFLESVENVGYRDESIAGSKGMLEWLQSEVEG